MAHTITMDWVRLTACCVLAMLAWSDLRARRLPNLAVAAFAALYFVAAACSRDADPALAAHTLSGVVALFAAAVLFRFGLVGGGDAKLAAAVFLWAGPSYAASVFFIISVSGLMLGLTVFAVGRVAVHHTWARPRLDWLAPVRGVPYGVALATGGLVAVWLAPASMHALPHALARLS